MTTKTQVAKWETIFTNASLAKLADLEEMYKNLYMETGNEKFDRYAKMVNQFMVKKLVA
jgi:hypothetical protein